MRGLDGVVRRRGRGSGARAMTCIEISAVGPEASPYIQRRDVSMLPHCIIELISGLVNEI